MKTVKLDEWQRLLAEEIETRADKRAPQSYTLSRYAVMIEDDPYDQYIVYYNANGNLIIINNYDDTEIWYANSVDEWLSEPWMENEEVYAVEK